MPQQNTPAAGQGQVELSRLTIDAATATRLENVVAATGAPGTWHRRKALEEYLDRHPDAGS